MDYMNRGVRPNQQSPANSVGPDNSGTQQPKNGKLGKLKKAKWLNIATVALLFSVTVVVVAVAVQIAMAQGNKEGQYVDKNKMQAVFLNNGQVYFGKITELNSSYINLANIYYLRVNQQVQPGQQASQNDVSLVKLGCELHGPQDLMTVNRTEVTFWENLKDDGQVAKAVAEYVKQNPNGQNCEQEAQQQRSNSNTEGNANNKPAGTTNNTSNTTTNNANRTEGNN